MGHDKSVGAYSATEKAKVKADLLASVAAEFDAAFSVKPAAPPSPTTGVFTDVVTTYI